MITEPEDLPRHLRLLVENTSEVRRLVAIHEQVGGTGPGRRHDLEVLNKGAVVLLVACWESFVEDLADEAFDFLLSRARTPAFFPRKVLALAGDEVTQAKDQTAIWKLAGTGWLEVLRDHRGRLLERFKRPFNTPTPDKVDELFEALIGFRSPSRHWSWSGMPRSSVSRKLKELIELRGAIAHRVRVDRPVRKRVVEDYVEFVGRLAGVFSNSVGEHLARLCREGPWDKYRYVEDE